MKLNEYITKWDNYFTEALKNKDLILKEYILEPIMEMEKVEYVFFLRNTTVEAMKESGIKLNVIQYEWESKDLKVLL